MNALFATVTSSFISDYVNSWQMVTPKYFRLRFIYHFFIYIHITLDAQEVKIGVPTFLLPEKPLGDFLHETHKLREIVEVTEYAIHRGVRTCRRQMNRTSREGRQFVGANFITPPLPVKV